MPVFLVLTNVVSESDLGKAKPGDAVILGPGLSAECLGRNDLSVHRVSVLDEGQYRTLTHQLAEYLASCVDEPGGEIVDCFANDLFSYVLRPAFSTLFTLKQVTEERKSRRVTVISAKRTGEGVPLTGFQTTESKRGSDLLFGAYIAQIVDGVFPDMIFEFVETQRDIYCIEWLRRLVLTAANSIFSITFLLKCLVVGRQRKEPSDKLISSLGFVVRVAHQARFVSRIIAANDESARIFAFPQVSQLSLKAFRQMLSREGLDRSTVTVSTSSLFRAIRATRRDTKMLGKFSKLSRPVTLSAAGVSWTFNLSDVAVEINRISVVLLYKNIFFLTLASSGCKRLVNFELVGKMAGLEALVARQAGVELTTVQTAVVSETPHVVFPVSANFLADGPQALRSLGYIGAAKRGVISYQGAPFSIRPVKASKCMSCLTFFSQPYEPEVTCRILEVISAFCRKRRVVLVLKLHPRDNAECYQDVVSRNEDVLSIASTENVDSLLSRSDLCVTRTSSVARESMAVGVPVVLCLWSDLDRTIRADYSMRLADCEYRSFDAIDLPRVLGDFDKLNKAAVNLQSRLFEHKSVEDLAAALFSAPN